MLLTVAKFQFLTKKSILKSIETSPVCLHFHLFFYISGLFGLKIEFCHSVCCTSIIRMILRRITARLTFWCLFCRKVSVWQDKRWKPFVNSICDAIQLPKLSHGSNIFWLRYNTISIVTVVWKCQKMSHFFRHLKWTIIVASSSWMMRILPHLQKKKPTFPFVQLHLICPKKSQIKLKIIITNPPREKRKLLLFQDK